MRKLRVRFLKDLSFTDSVLLGIGFIIGSGIFLMPLLAAQEAGTYSIVAWIIAGIFGILTAFCFAECAAKLPRAGGLYSYAHEAFGNFTGFLTGWSFWIGYWITIATEQWAIAWYLKFFLPQLSDLIRVAIATSVGFVLTYINFRGVKMGGDVEDAFTIGKLIPLLLFGLVGLFFINYQNFYPLLPQGKLLAPAIGSATILVLWAYQGTEIITVPEEEVKNARRVVPKAILISAFTVMGVYLLISFVFLGISRWEVFSNSQSPLADASKLFLGDIGGLILAVGGLISIVGALNAVILASARISFAMARDKLFPKSLSILHKKFRTPVHALLLQTILATAVTFLITDFVTLASLVVFFTIIPYFFSSIAVLKLIKKSKGQLHILKTRLIPIIAAAFSLWLLTQFSSLILVVGLLLLLVGIAFYLTRKPFLRL